MAEGFSFDGVAGIDLAASLAAFDEYNMAGLPGVSGAIYRRIDFEQVMTALLGPMPDED